MIDTITPPAPDENPLPSFRKYEPHRSHHSGIWCPLVERWEKGKAFALVLDEGSSGDSKAALLAAAHGLSRADVYGHADFFKKFKRHEVKRECARGTPWRSIKKILRLDDKKKRTKLLRDRKNWFCLDWESKVAAEIQREYEAKIEEFHRGERSKLPDGRGKWKRPAGMRRKRSKSVELAAMRPSAIREQIKTIAFIAREFGWQNTEEVQRIVQRVGELVARASTAGMFTAEVYEKLRLEISYVSRRIAAADADAGRILRDYISEVEKVV